MIPDDELFGPPPRNQLYTILIGLSAVPRDDLPETRVHPPHDDPLAHGDGGRGAAGRGAEQDRDVRLARLVLVDAVDVILDWDRSIVRLEAVTAIKEGNWIALVTEVKSSEHGK